MSDNNTKTEKRRERRTGWTEIGAVLDWHPQRLKRHVLTHPDSPISKLLKRDQSTGRPWAFLDDLNKYIDDAPPFSEGL